MADVKISDLVSANVVNKNDLFLLVQDDSSKNVSAGTLFSSITDPTLSGNIFFGGPVQSLTGIGTVSITTTRTDLYGGVSADTAAIANGSVLPSTIYLYTDGVSASGRGLQFQDGSPFFKTIYVQHINGKINLSLGANAIGTLNHAPEDWVGPTGLRPFNDGLYFVKGAAYTFDVSHPTNAGNIIGLSTSIDGTNTLGLEYTPGVVRTGNPGNAGATVEFTPANVSIDPGGKNYLDIPQGVDGQLKVINLVSTGGGQFVISSNIQNNLAIELRKAGDSAFLMYSGNAWILVGSNPGLQTSFSGTSDDIPEGEKLYFTNARARAAISVPDNTLIYNATTGSIRANVLALSNINLGNIIPNSDSIPEGAVNFYYSNARVHANLRLASIDALADVDTTTIAPQTGYALIWNGTRWIPNVIAATALTGTVNFSNIAERANVSNTVLSLSNFTTANLLESASNLYYSNARVFANLSLANINVLADVDTVTVAPAYGDALSWNGNTWVPIAVSATNALTANLANLVSSLSNFTTANLAEGTNLYYTNARVNAQISLNLALKANVVDLTTSNVAELNNLYYTNARVYSNLSLASINALADVDTATTPPSSGQALGWNGTAWIPTTFSSSSANTANQANVANAVLSLDNFTTSNLAEGSNLYYTNARVYANVIGLLNAKANVLDLTTANVIESAGNLYFTNARVYANVSPLLDLKANIVDLTTANVLESASNLYYTNARVFANLSLANINVLQDVEAINPTVGQVLSWSGNAWIANSVSIPSTEYSNIANTVISVVAASLTANIANLVLTLNNFTTANLAEGTNLYYTNARVNAQVESNLALKANVVDLTTANVVELNNLYYTNARVDSHVNPKLTTANVVELNNLYYTNARVNAQVESNLALKANVVDLTTANVIESASNLYYTNDRVYANVTDRFASINTNLVPDTDEAHDLGAPDKKWKDLYLSGFSITLGSTKITSGAGGALSVQALASNSNVTTKSITSNIWNNLYTANVLETNGNLYYTNARVRSTLSNGTGVYYDKVTGAISIGQNVDTTSNVTFAGLNVFGQTNFYGNVTTYSSNNLSISDNMIYLNSSSESSNPDLGFAGNYNDGTYRHAGFFRDASDAGTWKVYDSYALEPDANIFIDTDHASFRLANIAATTVRSNLIGNVTGFVSTISNFSTTNLVEGDQLYYTNARVDSHVDPKLTTANVVELNNLYYSNDRVESYVNPKLTTANVIESSNNRYYTNARVNAQVESNLALKANIVDLTTANVAELNNLYYSNARVLSNVAQMSINVFADVDISGIGNNGILIWNGTSFVAGAATTATEANFANVAGTANVALVANFANVAGTANVANTVLSINNFTTSNLAEGTNLYYTNARVYSNVIASLPTYTGNVGAGNVTIGSGTGGSIIGANLISAVNISATNWQGLYSANVIESQSALYYSNARVLSNVAQMSINVFADVDITGIANTDILIWNGTSFVAGSIPPATSANFANVAETANVALVTNFANVAATSNVANIVLSISNFTTSNLAEGTNLYYTNARVNTQVESNLVLKANVTDLTTANVIESLSTLTDRTYGVTASGSSAYVFTGYSSGNNIAITAEAGTVLTFNVNASGHPFWIKTVATTGTGSAVTTGVTNNGAQIGTVVWDTAGIAPGTYYYICQFHGSMVGTITIIERPHYLYYTNARVNAQVESNLRLKANVTDLTTANVVELNNLYYSNARVLSNVAQMSINVFADVDISNIQPNDTLVWDGTKFIKANAGQSTAIVANVTTTGNVEITRFSTATYSTAKYVYTAKGTSVGYTNKYNSGELLVLHDDTSSFITQYAMISNDNNLDLLSFQAGINNGNVIIYGNVSDPAIQVTVKLTGATYTEK
jgi:plastocyanin